MDLAKRCSTGVLLASVLLGGLVLAGCDDNVEVIRDPDIHLTKGMTWAWRPMGAPALTGRPVVSRDVITSPAARLLLRNIWRATATGTPRPIAIN